MRGISLGVPEAPVIHSHSMLEVISRELVATPRPILLKSQRPSIFFYIKPLDRGLLRVRGRASNSQPTQRCQNVNGRGTRDAWHKKKNSKVNALLRFALENSRTEDFCEGMPQSAVKQLL